MNRTLSLILAIILALCLLVGVVGGTYAYFSDAETSNDNHMTAGTLDLVSLVSGSYSGDSSLYSVTVGGNGINGYVAFNRILPGETGTIKWVISNTGNTPGTFTISATCTFDENGSNEPEAAIPSNNTGGNGDLDEYVTVTLQRGVGTDQTSAEAALTYILGTAETPVAMGGLEAALNAQSLTLGASGGNDTIIYVLTWSLPDHELINVVQSDTAEIDITFSLVQ
ncbi:MAG: TasA family protein [Dehalococcoidales bacterium]